MCIRDSDDGAYHEVRVVACVLSDPATVHKELFPLLIKQLPGREIALGRAYPGLRPAIVHKLVQDVSLTNATYAGGTGLAEMIPGLGIPFAVADVIILTKNQVIRTYKLALMFGYPAEIQKVLAELAGVVGGGFLWPQVTAQLVGFGPIIGPPTQMRVGLGGPHGPGAGAEKGRTGSPGVPPACFENSRRDACAPARMAMRPA